MISYNVTHFHLSVYVQLRLSLKKPPVRLRARERERVKETGNEVVRGSEAVPRVTRV